MLRLALVPPLSPKQIGGKLYYAPRKDIFGELFYMRASFRGECYCCEYRQYVKGAYQYQIIDPVTKKPGPWIEGTDHNYPTFVEDGSLDMPPHPYGHRFGYTNLFTDAYISSPYGGTSQRSHGCEYYGSDLAGLPGIQAFVDAAGKPHRLLLFYDFRGEIRDVCVKKIIKTAKWTVRCSTVIYPNGGK